MNFPIKNYSKYLRLIIKLELLVLAFVCIERIYQINTIFGISPHVRGFMNIVDLESGWTFIILLILAINNFHSLKYPLNRLHWVINFSGLLSILFIMALSFNYFLILIIFLIIYFALNDVVKQFNIVKNKYWLVVLCFVIGSLMTLLQQTIYLIYY